MISLKNCLYNYTYNSSEIYVIFFLYKTNLKSSNVVLYLNETGLSERINDCRNGWLLVKNICHPKLYFRLDLLKEREIFSDIPNVNVISSNSRDA